jgi:hypothetical protein
VVVQVKAERVAVQVRVAEVGLAEVREGRQRVS